MTDLDIFKIEARKVRKWAIRKDKYQRPGLWGWCTTCSVKLFKILKEKGYKPIFSLAYRNSTYSNAHCFILCNDYIIDVTATQFDNEDKAINIFKVGKNRKCRRWYWNYNNCDKFENMADIAKAMSDFPEDQNPFMIINNLY